MSDKPNPKPPMIGAEMTQAISRTMGWDWKTGPPIKTFGIVGKEISLVYLDVRFVVPDDFAERLAKNLADIYAEQKAEVAKLKEAYRTPAPEPTPLLAKARQILAADALRTWPDVTETVAAPEPAPDIVSGLPLPIEQTPLEFAVGTARVHEWVACRRPMRGGGFESYWQCQYCPAQKGTLSESDRREACSRAVK